MGEKVQEGPPPAPFPALPRSAFTGVALRTFVITDDFDKDFGVDEWHGHNIFFRDENNAIFRTYFINARGDEAMGSVWNYVDATALGRQEDWEHSPVGYPKAPPYKWWRWHDAYGSEDAKWDTVIHDALVTLKL